MWTIPERQNAPWPTHEYSTEGSEGNTSEVRTYLASLFEDETNEVEKKLEGVHIGISARSRPIDNIADPRLLSVTGVEMYPEGNASDHHTLMYDQLQEVNKTVLRRGQPFYMAIRFNRPPDFQNDRVSLQFYYGPRPQPHHGTLVILPINHKIKEFTSDNTSWDVRFHNQDGSTITVYVKIPANIPIGIWKLKIISDSGNEMDKTKYNYGGKIYILFNPWCKEDTVYMPDESLLEEYVLSETGKICNGNHKSWGIRDWIYGQFERHILPAAMLMMEKSKLDYPARNNPIHVARVVSAMVNSNDKDGGVLVGRWDGKYEDGTQPSAWAGSSEILKQYLESRGQPIKYGQCWVFAGLCATVCRALGIPTRTVTNFLSAHNSNHTLLAIEEYVKKDGSLDKEKSRDSVWNFHVWNDCWMARPDLPPGYGGWQAVDATPQERSKTSKKWQTGPAPLRAIQKGEIGFLYDTEFVFSEINADVYQWIEDENSRGGYRWNEMKTNYIGKFILTQKPGEDAVEDITNQYKYREGTIAERVTVLNAAKATQSSEHLAKYYNVPTPKKEDVSFELVDIEKIMIGDPFDISIKIQNKSNEVRRVLAILSASSVYYTGVHAGTVKSQQNVIKLQPREGTVHTIRVSSNEYMDKLVEYCNMKIYALATVRETKQTWSGEDDFQVQKPSLNLKVSGDLRVAKPFVLVISFTNPLNSVLRECTFTIEGPGISQSHVINFRNVQPKELVVHEETLTPKKSGTRRIAVVFTSRDLVDVTGSKQVEIAPK